MTASHFEQVVLDACAREREVELTTHGRTTGQPSQVILWIVTDGQRLYIRSGGGLGRDWPRNLMQRQQGVLRVAGLNVPVRPRHVTDRDEARAASDLYLAKYGGNIQRSHGDEPLTPGESACFELLPAQHGNVDGN
jgi:hypothetical protein